jgi:hypothetical protein
VSELFTAIAIYSRIRNPVNPPVLPFDWQMKVILKKICWCLWFPDPSSKAPSGLFIAGVSHRFLAPLHRSTVATDISFRNYLEFARTFCDSKRKTLSGFILARTIRTGVLSSGIASGSNAAYKNIRILLTGTFTGSKQSF